MLKPPKIEWIIFFALIGLTACDLDGGDQFPPINYEYPSSLRDTNYRDNYFGLSVRDPYQWMENPASNLTRQWIQNQRDLTSTYLDQIGFRSNIVSRLQQLWSYQRVSVPFPVGNDTLQFIQSEYTRQPVLYRIRGNNNEGEVIFDPNEVLAYRDVAFSNWSFSEDGKYVATVVEEPGGQLQTIIVIDLDTGQILPDEIIGVKDCRIVWHRNGFYYSKYEELEMGGSGLEADYFHQLYYHELGAPVVEDELIFADRSRPMQVVWPQITDDGAYLVLKLKGIDQGNKIYIKNLRSDNTSFERLVEQADADYDFVGKRGNQALMFTNDQAPNGQLVSMSLTRPGGSEREVIIPESEKVLQSVTAGEDHLLAVYDEEGASSLVIFDDRGNNPRTVALPQPGSVGEVVILPNDAKAYLHFSSFLEAPTIYEVDLEEGGLRTFMSTYTAFNTNEYQVRKVRYRSFDGESVPMFLLHKRGMELSPNTPALLFGNGSKYYSLGPKYNLTGLQLIPFFLESDGLVAIPLIRGTPEMGAFWYELGIQNNRQKAFDDFQAAATYLIEQGFTSVDKLASYGQGPVGGLLAAACVVQRPDLFGAVVAREGIYDLLRYHQFTTAWKYADELGITEKQEDFDPLWAIDPRRNAISTEYPATLMVASTANVEIAPFHTYKLTAELQARQQAQNPVLLRLGNNFIDRNLRPHGRSVEEGADILSFLFYQLEHHPFQREEVVQ